jgi:hypothetical protein
MSVFAEKRAPQTTVIPAQAGIQRVGLFSFMNNQMNDLDSRLRGNDDEVVRRPQSTHRF